MSRLRALGALAAVAALALAPESKHAGGRTAFGGRQRDRPNRLSPKEYEALAFHREQLRRAPGSQAMHRMRREAERDVRRALGGAA